MNLKKTTSLLLVCALFLVPGYASSQNIIDAASLIPSVSITFSPSSGSFIEGSTFEVPIILDTRGNSINTIRLRVYFDPSRLAVVRPSGEQSIIGLWLEPPSFDNTKGVVEYVGAIPNGIVTSSGVIGTLLFTTKNTGNTTLSIRGDTEILLNNGLGSQAKIEAGRANYRIEPRPLSGLQVLSDTHPFREVWYNNASPVFYWEKPNEVTGFSYVLDTIPTTVPDTTVDTEENIKAYEDLKDGLWYFHIRALKDGVWGETGRYMVRIDTTPPAAFKPEVEYMLASVVTIDRALVSFFTTDNLSGIARYEVGVLDKSEEATEAPLFVESASPYQLPVISEVGMEVIVRAVDNAGNVTDARIEVARPHVLWDFIRNYGIIISIFLFLLLGMWSILHFMYGHHVLARVRKFVSIWNKEEKEERKKLNKKTHKDA